MGSPSLKKCLIKTSKRLDIIGILNRNFQLFNDVLRDNYIFIPQHHVKLAGLLFINVTNIRNPQKLCMWCGKRTPRKHAIWAVRQCQSCSELKKWHLSPLTTIYTKYGNHFDLDTILKSLPKHTVTSWHSVSEPHFGYVYTDVLEKKLDEVNKQHREAIHIDYMVRKYMEISHFTVTSVKRILDDRVIHLCSQLHTISGPTTLFGAVCSRGDNNAIELCIQHFRTMGFTHGLDIMRLVFTILSRKRSARIVGLIMDLAHDYGQMQPKHTPNILLTWILQNQHHNIEVAEHMKRHNIFVFNTPSFLYHDLIIMTLSIDCMLPIWNDNGWFNIVETFGREYHSAIISNVRIPRHVKNKLYSHITCKSLEWNVDIDTTTLLSCGINTGFFQYAKRRYYAVRRLVRWYRNTHTSPKCVSVRPNKRMYHQVSL